MFMADSEKHEAIQGRQRAVAGRCEMLDATLCSRGVLCMLAGAYPRPTQNSWLVLLTAAALAAPTATGWWLQTSLCALTAQ